MDAAYNDIGQWKFKDLVGVFGADPKRSKTFQVKTKQEAEDLFNDKEFCAASYLQVRLTLPVLLETNRSSSLNCTCPRLMLQKH